MKNFKVIGILENGTTLQFLCEKKQLSTVKKTLKKCGATNIKVEPDLTYGK